VWSDQIWPFPPHDPRRRSGCIAPPRSAHAACTSRWTPACAGDHKDVQKKRRSLHESDRYLQVLQGTNCANAFHKSRNGKKKKDNAHKTEGHAPWCTSPFFFFPFAAFMKLKMIHKIHPQNRARASGIGESYMIISRVFSIFAKDCLYKFYLCSKLIIEKDDQFLNYTSTKERSHPFVKTQRLSS
jgi:hypothetical protein